MEPTDSAFNHLAISPAWRDDSDPFRAFFLWSRRDPASHCVSAHAPSPPQECSCKFVTLKVFGIVWNEEQNHPPQTRLCHGDLGAGRRSQKAPDCLNGACHQGFATRFIFCSFFKKKLWKKNTSFMNQFCNCSGPRR